MAQINGQVESTYSTDKWAGRKHLLLIVFKAHRAVNASERALANKVQILELDQNK
jgi:microcompartment protein CcmK/EutM